MLNVTKIWTGENERFPNAKNTKDMWICFRNCISEPDTLKFGNEENGELNHTARYVASERFEME